MSKAIITIVDNEAGQVDFFLTLDPGADLNDPNVQLSPAQAIGVEIIKHAHFSQLAATQQTNS